MTAMGMLAWDAKEEMQARLERREQTEGLPVADDPFEILANGRIREAIEQGDFCNLKGMPLHTRAHGHMHV
jgi:hypothetical protein